MSGRLSAANLAQSTKDLWIEWEQTKASWRDVKADEFERTYLDQIPDAVTRTKAAMEEIDAILRKVRADCE